MINLAFREIVAFNAIKYIMRLLKDVWRCVKVTLFKKIF